MKHEATVFKTLDLPGGSVVPFPSLPGERVRVLYGRIWLTEEGSLRDAVLAPGEEVALGTRGLAVIEALGPARIELFKSIGLAGVVVNATRRLTRSLTASWARQFAARSHYADLDRAPCADQLDQQPKQLALVGRNLHSGVRVLARRFAQLGQRRMLAQ
jgi:hypothetical protein